MFLIVNILNSDYHIDYIRKSESSFFDRDLLGKFSSDIKIVYFKGDDQESCLNTIVTEIDDITHLLIVKDRRISVNEELYHIGFVGHLDYKDNPLSNQYLTKQINKIIKNFRYINGLYQNGDDIELLRLPFLNFRSELYLQLPQILKELSSEEGFQDAFNQCMSSIRRKHRKPKRRSEGKKKLFLDNDDKYFDLGKEIHSRHETGSPHGVLCNLKAHLRFGLKLDERKHFNVSYCEPDIAKINGDYSNCHKEIVTFRGRAHLNIFSNDFLT